MTFTVLDLSKYQFPSGNVTDVDFARAKAAGCDAVIIESADEDGVVDPLYGAAFDAAKAAGLGVGSYLFGRPDVPATTTADLLTALLERGPAWLDIEVEGFTDPLERVILASCPRASTYVPDYVDWGPYPGGPWPWTTGDVWTQRVLLQTGVGTFDGFPTEVDVDVFTGSLADFNDCFRLAAPAPSPRKPVDRVVGMVGCSTGGYWLVDELGDVFNFGGAPLLGSLKGRKLNAPIAGIAAAGPRGYFLVGQDGGVFAFGTARFKGSVPGLSELRKRAGG